MQVKLPISEWRTRKLFIATPMHTGSCVSQYLQSMLSLQSACFQLGIELIYGFLDGESLITRARNKLCDDFLRSDCTHIIFIDSDIGFAARDVITLLGLMSESSAYDVMGGAYPLKRIDWKQVKSKADAGRSDLSMTGATFVLRRGQVDRFCPDAPAQVEAIGTGFMMIRRSIFSRLKAQRPSENYIHDFSNDLAGAVQMYFHADIDPATRTYLPEDYWFCRNVMEAGGQIWLCPWMCLEHVGNHVFSGRITDA